MRENRKYPVCPVCGAFLWYLWIDIGTGIQRTGLACSRNKKHLTVSLLR